MNKIIALVGSNSKKSSNRDLLRYIARSYSSQADIELIELANHEANLSTIFEKIQLADGLIIASPEYDNAPSSLLLSFMESISSTNHPLVNKPTLLISASHGRVASIKSLAKLRQILTSPNLSLKVFQKEYTLSQAMDAFDIECNLISKEKQEELQLIINEFITFIEKEKIGEKHFPSKIIVKKWN